MLRTPNGILLTVMRTSGADGYLYQARSTHDGWTWQALKRTPIWGCPCRLLWLRSGILSIPNGYRSEPLGVHAVMSSDGGKSWNMECEMVTRADGLHWDLAHPASIQL